MSRLGKLLEEVNRNDAEAAQDAAATKMLPNWFRRAPY
jgi:hypothetical protein